MEGSRNVFSQRQLSTLSRGGSSDLSRTRIVIRFIVNGRKKDRKVQVGETAESRRANFSERIVLTGVPPAGKVVSCAHVSLTFTSQPVLTGDTSEKLGRRVLARCSTAFQGPASIESGFRYFVPRTTPLPDPSFLALRFYEGYRL